MQNRQVEETNTLTKCALCKNPSALRDSHFIPAALYRIARTSNPPKGMSPDPIILSTSAAVQSSLQLKSRLLCEPCENKFSRQGEQIVINECLHTPDKFLLREKLRVETSDITNNNSKWFSGVKLGTIDVQSYKYFATSMFWRGSAGQWIAPGSQKWRGALGEKYQEAFRQYLLGTSSFPSQALLVLFVSNEDNPTGIATVTSHKKKNGYHIHEFYIHGVKFRMFLGNRIDPLIESLFEHLKTNTIFVLSDSRFEPGFPDPVKFVQAAKPKGKLLNYKRK